MHWCGSRPPGSPLASATFGVPPWPERIVMPISRASQCAHGSAG